MKLYTMGFTQKSAQQFFEKIRENNIELLIDVRLNNQSQLAGFTKGKDLQYFLKAITDCEYDHEVDFAPTKELLNNYKRGELEWAEYEKIYNNLIQERNMVNKFTEKTNNYSGVLLLCSEVTPEKCHRRLLAEAIQKRVGCEIKHI